MMNNSMGPSLDIEELKNMSDDSLSEAKIWLFKENMRLASIAKELDERAENLQKEENSLRKEISDEMKKIRIKESQLILEKKHVDDRLHILRRGFEELNADRAAFEAKQNNSMTKRVPDCNGIIFFRGVDSKAKLKKRYKELLKIFHPDNNCGDEETILLIKSEYEELDNMY